MGKEFYNANVQNFLKKHNINLKLFYVFHNESVDRWTVQSYVEEWYVETVYNENYK